MAQLESENKRQDAPPDDGSPKYMPSTKDSDPIVQALKTVLKCEEVTGNIYILYIYVRVNQYIYYVSKCKLEFIFDPVIKSSNISRDSHSEGTRYKVNSVADVTGHRR